MRQVAGTRYELLIAPVRIQTGMPARNAEPVTPIRSFWSQRVFHGTTQGNGRLKRVSGYLAACMRTYGFTHWQSRSERAIPDHLFRKC